MKAVCRSRNSAIKSLDDYIAKTGIGCNWEKPQLVEIRPYKPPRSLEQNARMHSMFRQLANFTGYSESEIKDYCKSEVGPHKVIAIDQVKDVPKGTSEYSKLEASDMIEHLYRIGAEVGCVFTDGED